MLTAYGSSPEACERRMAMCLGEVIVRNHAESRRVVREFPFVTGTYEIGVDRGTLAVMLTRHRRAGAGQARCGPEGLPTTPGTSSSAKARHLSRAGSRRND